MKSIPETEVLSSELEPEEGFLEIVLILDCEFLIQVKKINSEI